MRAQVHSAKHYVQKSLTTVLAGAVNITTIARGEEVSAVNTADDVREGSILKAVYIELWLRTNDTSPGSYVCVVEKRPGIGISIGISAADMANLHDYENKKNILFTSQALSNDQDADAIPVLRQWIKIPKSKQRFGLKDALVLNFFSQALDQNICGFMTYKEYF